MRNEAQEEHPFLPDVYEACEYFGVTVTAEARAILLARLSEVSDAELAVLEPIEESLHRYFYLKVRRGEAYCDPAEIEREFGMSPEERTGLTSGGYYRLFVAYWTLKVKWMSVGWSNVERFSGSPEAQAVGGAQWLSCPVVYCIDALVSGMDIALASSFFPTAGGEKLVHGYQRRRREQIETTLAHFAPDMTLEELFEGAPHMAPRAGCLGVLFGLH